MALATVLAAIIMAAGTVVAAMASVRTHREVKTNHGKRNGQYVEELAQWAEFHTLQDAEHFAELRHALGLPPKPFLSRPIDHL